MKRLLGQHFCEGGRGIDHEVSCVVRNLCNKELLYSIFTTRSNTCNKDNPHHEQQFPHSFILPAMIPSTSILLFILYLFVDSLPSCSSVQLSNDDDSTTITCPTRGRMTAATELNGYDDVRRYTEISGLAISPTVTVPATGNPIMYVINDGHEDRTGEGRIGIYDSGVGQRLVTLVISNTTTQGTPTTHFDWEALAIGTCGGGESSFSSSSSSQQQQDIFDPSSSTRSDPYSPVGEDDRTCLYIADIGDNVARNTEGKRSDRTQNTPYRILKLLEPSLELLLGTDYRNSNEVPNSKTAPEVVLPATHWLGMLDFNYLHASSPTEVADSEAFFLDPVGWGKGGAPGDLYVVTKWNDDTLENTRLFQIPVSAWSQPSPYSPMAVGDYDTASRGELLRLTWTGADMSRPGTLVALSTEEQTILFLRCPGATVAEALTNHNDARACHKWWHPSNGQVETVAWTPDGNRVLDIPEGARPKMGWTTMNYSTPTLTSRAMAQRRTCPKLEWVHPLPSGDPFCRTVDSRRHKPDEWCLAAPYSVSVVVENIWDEDSYAWEEDSSSAHEEELQKGQPQPPDADDTTNDKNSIWQPQNGLWHQQTSQAAAQSRQSLRDLKLWLSLLPSLFFF
jgi:hypothetical protein